MIYNLYIYYNLVYLFQQNECLSSDTKDNATSLQVCHLKGTRLYSCV